MSGPAHNVLRPAARRRVLLTAAGLLGMASLCIAQSAPAVLRPGEPAPPFNLTGPSGASMRFDAETSATILMVFVKPQDRYTSATLAALNHSLDAQPAIRRLIVRCLIAQSLKDGPPASLPPASLREGWTTLLDPDGQVSKAYRIIATPTLVIVGPDRKVRAVNPGYDFGLADHTRHELALLLGIELASDKPAAKPNMNLQMGRRMAARGLWDSALDYYLKAAKEAPLAPAADLELAEVYIELRRAPEALAILDRVGNDAGLRAKSLPLRIKAEELGKRTGATPSPPRIER